MAYTKQTWQDLPSKTTPINASRLGHIEQGIYDAASTADTAASNASSAISGLADKVDKVEGKGLSTNDFTDALKTKLDNIEAGAEVNVQSDWNQSDNSADDYIKNKPSLGTSAYKNSTSVVTQSSDLVESGAVYDVVGWGNKNFLPNNLESLTKNTVVITVNNDKSVKLNGTATSNANVALCDLTNSDLPSGNYILSSVLHSNNKFIKAEAYNGSMFVSTLATTQSGDNQEFAVDWNGYNTITVSIRLLTTATYNNETFYPMIRLASVTDDTYEPYHESVEQTLRNANLINGKNEADISEVDKTFTLLKSGERTRYIYLNKEISAGNKILSIKISNASNMSLALRYQLLYNNTQVTSGNLGSTDNGVYNLPVNITSTINRLYFFISDSDNNNATCTVSDLMISTEGGEYEPYYVPLKDVVPNKCDNSVIAPVENGATSSKAYAVGEHFIRDGAFCTCKQAISQGGSFTLNTNYTAGDVADSLVKQDTFNVTTNANGVATLCNNDRIVVAVKSAGHVLQSYITAGGTAINIKANDYLGNTEVNTNIVGTYFYI